MKIVLLAVTVVAFVGIYYTYFFHRPPPLTALPQEGVVVALGDSLTFGTGSSVSYPQILETLIERKVINAGVPGETSDETKQRLADILAQYQPQFVIICIGGNDFLRRHNTDMTTDNIRIMLQQLKEKNINVLLVAVPRIAPFPINHGLYLQLAKEFNIWIEDQVLKKVLHDTRLKSDTVHPNAAGYQEIANAIFKRLQESGAIP